MITSKQRAYLRGLANSYETLFQVGKSGVTDTLLKQVEDALKARELIKISVLKNCFDDPRAIAEVLAERTRSEVVQVVGKKITLYKESKNKKKIELPKQKKNV
jgi:RNA-binding protein